jgi:hypothetical protein
VIAQGILHLAAHAVARLANDVRVRARAWVWIRGSAGGAHPRGTTAVGIGSFNLGIELAQIGVALALVPVLYRSTCSRVGAHLIGWLRR